MYESSTVATNDPSSLIILIFALAITVATVIGWWKLFEKADEAGWKSIIPFYNTYTYFRITGRNGWTVLLILIPIVNIFFWIRGALEMGKRFNKSTLYSVFALLLIPAIGAIDLGFGEAQYSGLKHE